MKNLTLFKTVLIATSLPLLAGCVERQVVYRDRPVYAGPRDEVVVVTPENPPPPQVEVIPPAPNREYVWVGGGWEWRHARWVWVGGHWGPRPHLHAVWVPGGWVHRGHGHVWVSGHWR